MPGAVLFGDSVPERAPVPYVVGRIAILVDSEDS